MIDLTFTSYPVTCRYHSVGPAGPSQHELTVDFPQLAFNPTVIKDCLVGLWQTTVARATVDSVRLTGVSVALWKEGLVQHISLPPQIHGLSFGQVAPRKTTAVLVQHSDHRDRAAARRLYLPGIPAAWVEDGLLTPSALNTLESLAQSMVMGMGVAPGFQWGRWAIPYPLAVDPRSDNVFGVAFRWVQSVYLLQYAERLPDLASGPWPA